MMLYTADGRVFRRRIGFSDDSIEVVQIDSNCRDGLVDLCGCEIECSEQLEVQADGKSGESD